LYYARTGEEQSRGNDEHDSGKGKPMIEFDEHEWSTVIVEPSLWWRLKALFIPPKIIFCWGQDKFALRGFKGEMFHSVGGLPTKMRDEVMRSMHD